MGPAFCFGPQIEMLLVDPPFSFIGLNDPAAGLLVVVGAENFAGQLKAGGELRRRGNRSIAGFGDLGSVTERRGIRRGIEDLGNLLLHARTQVAGAEHGDAGCVKSEGGEEDREKNGEDPAFGAAFTHESDRVIVEITVGLIRS